jgi:hypothetical protein
VNARVKLQGLGKRIGRAEGPRRPRRTTSETRQELDRVLAEIEARPPVPPEMVRPTERPTVATVEREIDRVLGVLARPREESFR